ncbi:MAG TPA: 2-phospho-L-lactate transferase CofD family protein [Candidatus Saccharimonadales bacterium]|nr:2-phospho-L-lactate transferase CofD family protein [Candidatus Saccharimonadales bacterium]
MSTHEQPNQYNDVLFGGGSIAQLSAGLAKALPDHHVTRVITVSDSGGATGPLARKFQTLPTGDLRKTISEGADSPAVRFINEQRFGPEDTTDTVLERASQLYEALDDSNPHLDTDRVGKVLEDTVALSRELKNLKGLAIGHLLLTNLALNHDNDMGRAVDEMADWMMVKGRILPATLERHDLVMADGLDIIRGEEAIDTHFIKNRGNVRMWLHAADPARPAVPVNPQVRDAIAQADGIAIGPGSHYTSLIPALLPAGTPEALKDSWITYVGNLQNNKHDTWGWTGTDHIQGIESYLGRPIDAVIYDNSSREQLGESGVVFDEHELIMRGYQTAVRPLLLHSRGGQAHDALAAHRSNVMHNPSMVADAYTQVAA